MHLSCNRMSNSLSKALHFVRRRIHTIRIQASRSDVLVKAYFFLLRLSSQRSLNCRFGAHISLMLLSSVLFPAALLFWGGDGPPAPVPPLQLLPLFSQRYEVCCDPCSEPYDSCIRLYHFCTQGMCILFTSSSSQLYPHSDLSPLDTKQGSGYFTPLIYALPGSRKKPNRIY